MIWVIMKQVPKISDLFKKNQQKMKMKTQKKDLMKILMTINNVLIILILPIKKNFVPCISKNLRTFV